MKRRTWRRWAWVFAVAAVLIMAFAVVTLWLDFSFGPLSGSLNGFVYTKIWPEFGELNAVWLPESMTWQRQLREFFRMPKYIPAWVDVPPRIVISLWLPALISATVAFICWCRGRSPKPGHCTECGYDLTGNVSGVCPECGTAVPAETK